MDAPPTSIRTSIPPTAEAFRQWVAEPQHRRFMRLRFPHGDGPDAPLLVQRLDAEESLSRDFSFVVELLTDDAHLPLKSMMGKLLVIELVREDGHLRYFSGYVFAFSRQRADGAVVVYEAQLGPWFRLLSLRRDHHLFHDKTLHQQTADIFADYPLHARWQWQVSSGDATMTDAFQYGESDHNYLSRRWEAAGWHYWYEHDASGHTLIVGSDSCQQAAIDGEHSVRFHGNGGSAEDDAIDRWSPQREMAAGSVVLGSFDFKSPTPRWMEVPTLNRQGVAPSIEHYLYTGHHGYRDRDDGDAQSRLRIEEIEARARQVEGQGNCRAMMPGRWFRLVGHVECPRFGGPSSRGRDEFLILSVRHRIHNNYFPLAAQDAVPPYRNEFRCMRRQIPWRPGPGYNSHVPIARGPQTATVMGVPGQPALWTDEYARVRVQFHWDREGRHDIGSSAWIRVASPWAGAQLGALALPRVGAEVLVQWLDGNPDRPVIVGSLYNADHLPPWALPAQRALTGLRSRELTDDGGNRALGRSNHLILDDTAGRLQAQFRSDQYHSQLSLGHLCRIDDQRGRQEARGQGWELRTDAWGVLRAGRGMLVTTEARPRARRHAKDLGETLARLVRARQEQQALARLAQQASAQEADAQQAQVAAALHAQNQALRGKDGPDEEEGFPELATPLLVLASPAGIAASSGQDMHLASTADTAVTAGRHIALSAGGGFFASVRESLRLFVQREFIRTVKVLAKQPGADRIKAYIRTRDEPLMERLIQQESRFKHVINKDLEPIVAGDRGFGVVQLTNPMPGYSQIWSWKENVDAGIALLRKKRAAAKRDFEKEKPVSYTEEMLDTETITRWNGGKYHEWDQDKKKWVRQKSILCDTKTGNIGWDMTLESNSGKTESELHDRDKLTYSKMKAGQNEEHAWKYSGVCYADHIAAK